LIYTYSVPDMGACCVDGVTQAFKNDALFGGCDVLVSHDEHTVILKLDDDDAFNLLEDRDVHARVAKILDDIGQRSEPCGVTTKPVGWSHASKGVLGLLSGFFLLFLPLFVTSIPWFLTVMFASASLGLTVALGWTFYRHAYRGLWKGNWTMDTLFSISTGAILLVSVAALFVPGLPMMFEAGLLIFGFRHAGLAIEAAFTARFTSRTRLQDDTALPQTVTLENGDIITRNKINQGDVFYVFPGETLPVDGVFVSGAGFTSNKYKHGSERLTALMCHKKLDAGTKLMSASHGEPLLFKAGASEGDSFLAQEDARILEAKFKRARANPDPKPYTAAYMLQYFIPTVVAVAFISAVVVGIYFASWVLALQCAVTVLVAACPCTFGLITPLVIQVGINKLKKDDVSFRIPDHLEAAAAVDCVVFDLNGTLTEGEPKVQRYTNTAMLALIATLEEGEPHPMAAAIREKTAERVQGTRQLMSRERTGICVKLDDVEYMLGNQSMMEKAGIAVDAPERSSCENVVYLASNGMVMGHVILEDKLRSEASRVVRALQQSGKNVRLCTGSDRATAELYARALHIDVKHVSYDCEPTGEHSKQAYVQDLQEQGYTVAMVGDYANDASAIAASDFGMAVAHTGGHLAAQGAAAAVIHDHSLLSVLNVFKTAERTVLHINQNLAFNLLYNVVAVFAPMGLLFGTGMMMSPAVGAALMMLQTLLIFANVYRFSLEDAPEVLPQSLFQTNSGACYGNTDVASISNSMGLTNANRKRLYSEVALDGADDTQSDGFDEFKRIRLN